MKKAIYTAEFEIMGYVDEDMNIVRDSSFVPQEGDEFYSPEEIVWHLKEKEKFEVIQAVRNNDSKLMKYLDSTDWYVTRQTETHKPIPKDVLVKRQEARDAIIGDT